jgi:hypothetical protein
MRKSRRTGALEPWRRRPSRVGLAMVEAYSSIVHSIPSMKRRFPDRGIAFVLVVVGATIGLFVLLVRNPIEAYIVAVEPRHPSYEPALCVDLFDSLHYTRTAPLRKDLLVEMYLWKIAAIGSILGAGAACGWLASRLITRRIGRRKSSGN